jgi:restriction system protein
MQLNAKCRHSQHIKLTNFQAVWDVRRTRVLRYTVDATNSRLSQHRTLSAADTSSLELKLQALLSGWDDKIDSQLETERIRGEKASAESLAMEAEAVRQRFTRILHKTLDRDDRVVWDQLKSRDEYKKDVFSGLRPKQPRTQTAPEAPVLERVGFIAGLFGGRKAALKRHIDRLDAHAIDTARVAEQAAAEKARFLSEMEIYRGEVASWEMEQAAKAAAHAEVVRDQHLGVETLKNAWITGDTAAIVEHASLVLDRSEYAGLFLADYELDWIEPSRTLLINYRLPTPDAVPRLKTAKLILSTGEMKETLISEKQHAEIYDDACYQICLRTIHELFEADEPEHVQAIVFNGLVRYFDRATGKEVTATTLSLSAERTAFLNIDLSRVDPKACFKSFKGVAAASLASMAAVPPVLQLNKADRRFVESREVNLDEQGGTNLAAMPWEEFEHLIRQVFGQVFSARGGEVKVTQASRDGGVDAVAFDPDPIGGGKIVIQAKRYTRTVGVSAVRDLYGTVMNEGANKGILVTTADYGPDAYAFAAGKPLTLLSGSNLLHLLGQHGVQARIDLAEARRFNSI